MAQGKEWNKEEIVETLKRYFILGYNVNKACELAQFPRSTFATWLQDDPELRQKVKAWQGMVNAKAREVVVSKVNNGDVDQARWWLERREKEDFSTRTENTGKDGEPLNANILQLIKNDTSDTRTAEEQRVETAEPVQDSQQAGATGEHEAEASPAPLPQEQNQ